MFDLAMQKIKVNPRSLVEQSGYNWITRFCIPIIKTIGKLVLEKILKGCDHIWAWWPCWSCDFDRLNNYLFSQPQETTCNLVTIDPVAFEVSAMFESIILEVSWVKCQNDLDQL